MENKTKITEFPWYLEDYYELRLKTEIQTCREQIKTLQEKAATLNNEQKMRDVQTTVKAITLVVNQFESILIEGQSLVKSK